ncbi:MAG: hypothetical protein C4541_06855 [Candidatus Auribacter fodinae]|jgi:hypothetical protein|uniref:PAS domain-containing protein n=1 Tax=Candidatus Auribacter fodinae TaxID=2093366 RepID=A0A3A4R8J4_9BACT|nr:MAG: hypothetical protein C4541_06855 [Candidatus Auribacter fodinae]
MYIQNCFRENLLCLDLESLSQSNDTVCVIDTDFRLVAFNEAWVNFAITNNGSDVLQKYPLGCVILDACFHDAKEFYRKAYAEILADPDRFDQDYECSSDAVHRLFHQTAYPLRNNTGILITHHLVYERQYAGTPHEFGAQHVSKDGFIVQCAHCRKVQDHSKPDTWDWVPSLVRDPLPNISHSFCSACLDFYYPLPCQ